MFSTVLDLPQVDLKRNASIERRSFEVDLWQVYTTVHDSLFLESSTYLTFMFYYLIIFFNFLSSSNRDCFSCKRIKEEILQDDVYCPTDKAVLLASLGVSLAFNSRMYKNL